MHHQIAFLVSPQGTYVHVASYFCDREDSVQYDLSRKRLSNGRGHPSKSPHVTVTTSMKTNVIFGSYITDVMRVDEADMNLKERFLLTGIHLATDIL